MLPAQVEGTPSCNRSYTFVDESKPWPGERRTPVRLAFVRGSEDEVEPALHDDTMPCLMGLGS